MNLLSRNFTSKTDKAYPECWKNKNAKKTKAYTLGFSSSGKQDSMVTTKDNK